AIIRIDTHPELMAYCPVTANRCKTCLQAQRHQDKRRISAKLPDTLPWICERCKYIQRSTYQLTCTLYPGPRHTHVRLSPFRQCFQPLVLRKHGLIVRVELARQAIPRYLYGLALLNRLKCCRLCCTERIARLLECYLARAKILRHMIQSP